MEEAEVKYEDEQLLVVDKPAFWLTTNENRKGKARSLEDWLGRKRKTNLIRNGIVNRLDKGTSGLVLVAKSKVGLEKLKKMQKAREIKKKYWVLVDGSAPLEGEIRMPIGRRGFGRGQFGVTQNGREAVTRFRRLDLLTREMRFYSLLEIDLLTGRTHQIRVHLSYLGWPVTGDRIYGGSQMAGLTRQFLHSKLIGLCHPVSGKWLEVEDNLASDLQSVLDNL